MRTGFNETMAVLQSSDGWAVYGEFVSGGYRHCGTFVSCVSARSRNAAVRARKDAL